MFGDSEWGRETNEAKGDLILTFPIFMLLPWPMIKITIIIGTLLWK